MATLEQIKIVVEKEVRPMLQADGGDIEVVDITESGVVRVRLQGNCQNCAASAMTLSSAVELRIKDHFPEVHSVEQIL